MKNLPSDLQILKKIYSDYYNAFASYSETEPDRSAKIYVPIDIDKLAEYFKVDGDIIFGCLYHHLEKKYGYKDDHGSLVSLFARYVGNDKHCINFPYMGSVLADLMNTNKQYWIATYIAVFSLLISVGSLIVSLFGITTISP